MLTSRRLAVLLLVTILLVSAGCEPKVTTVTVTVPPETVVVTETPPTSPVEVPPEPKVLTVCLVGEPDTLYLYGGSRVAATRHVMEALYDGPIDRINHTYQPVLLDRLPSVDGGDVVVRKIRVREGSRVVDDGGRVVDLAEEVRIRPQGCYAADCAVAFEGESLWMERMEVTYTIREDAVWSDGQPITADDSLFAYQVVSTAAAPGARYLVERTARYRTLDERRVRWVGLPGFIPPDYVLSFFSPLPRHQLKTFAPDELAQADETRRSPLGWGAFVVEEWVAGDHISLSRNPTYFRADEGLPRVDRVVYRFMSDASEMASGVLTGVCDVAVQDGDFEPLLPLLVQAEADGLLEVHSSSNNGWEHIEFGIRRATGYRRPEFFADVRVRQAIAQCIDRQAIVDEVTYGLGQVTDSYLPTDHPLYPKSEVERWDYDPVAGRTLLEEVGWVDEDESGVREAKGVQGIGSGVSFEVVLLVSAADRRAQQVARIVRANLADCGIRVEVETQPAGTFLAKGADARFLGRRFDLAETTWWFDWIPPCEHYLSDESPDVNPSGYADPDYDRACQLALQALPGTEEYQEYHQQAQVIFSNQLPAVPLFMQLRIAVTSPRLMGFVLDSTARSELWNIEMLDVE